MAVFASVMQAVVRHWLTKKKVKQEQRSALMSEFNVLVAACDGFGDGPDSKSHLSQVTKILIIYQLGLEHDFLRLPAYQVLQLRRETWYWNNYDVTFPDDLIKDMEDKLKKQYVSRNIKKLDGVLRVKGGGESRDASGCLMMVEVSKSKF